MLIYARETIRKSTVLISSQGNYCEIREAEFQLWRLTETSTSHSLEIILKLTYFLPWTIMEIRSTRSFNAIPGTLIRGVFNLYLNLLMKYIVNILSIHSFLLLFPFLLTIVIFLLFVANLYLLILTYLPE